MTAISSGRLKGKEALEDFENLSIESYPFKEGMIMPLPSRAKVALSAAETKSHIGYILRKSEIAIVKTSPPPLDEAAILALQEQTLLAAADGKMDVKVHQGGKNEVTTEKSSFEGAAVSQRKTRIYRGVVVQ